MSVSVACRRQCRPRRRGHRGTGSHEVESRSGSDRSDDSSGGHHATSTDISPLQPPQNPTRSGRRNRRRLLESAGGSVYVGSLPHHTRVSQFKAEVRHRNVNPLRVQWRGNNGFAFLNFRTLQEAEFALDALRGLQVSDDFMAVIMCVVILGKFFTPTSLVPRLYSLVLA